jgi:phosphoglycerate dehydrogenase-like enzyme
MPATPDTDRFFDAARLSVLKPGAVLVNTSRGRLVDEPALFDALSSGRLRAAGLDVFTQEPYVPPDPARDLRKLPNVVLTPHVASHTQEANERIQRLVLSNIGHFLAGRMDRLAGVPERLRGASVPHLGSCALAR